MLKFTKDHEWVSADGDTATVGITKYATEQLGDVVFVEVPEVGRKVTAGEACAVVESVKAASDVYAPVTGEVIAANADLAASPASVNWRNVTTIPWREAKDTTRASTARRFMRVSQRV